MPLIIICTCIHIYIDEVVVVVVAVKVVNVPYISLVYIISYHLTALFCFLVSIEPGMINFKNIRFRTPLHFSCAYAGYEGFEGIVISSSEY